jgi:Tfp pilus assembly protein FimT
MSAVDSEARSRRTTNIVIAAVFVVLAIVALLLHRSAKSTAAADDKADQLISELTAAGQQAPSKDQIVKVLGDDGGAVCDDPSSALKRAILYSGLSNGAGGPGQRPVIADSRAVRGELLIIKVYCPQDLPSFSEIVDDTAFSAAGQG